jgi:biotin synthase-like enzyme
MSFSLKVRKEYKVKGEQLVEKAKELVHAGNVNRLIVKSEHGQTLLEVPVTVGIVGAMLVPVWVALGAMAALANHYTLEVETHD